MIDKSRIDKYQATTDHSLGIVTLEIYVVAVLDTGALRFSGPHPASISASTRFVS